MSSIVNETLPSTNAVTTASFLSTNITFVIYGVIVIGLILLLVVACCLRLRYDARTRARYAYESEFDVRKELKRAAKKAAKLKEREALFEAARKSGVPLHVIMSAQRKRRDKRPVVFARRPSMTANGRNNLAEPINGHDADVDENDHDQHDHASDSSSDNDTNSAASAPSTVPGIRPLVLDAAR